MKEVDTTDSFITIRQMTENCKNKQKILHMVLIDLENIYCRIKNISCTFKLAEGSDYPYQKENATICDNHRVIALLANMGKIYMRILETKVKVCVVNTLSDCQYKYVLGS